MATRSEKRWIIIGRHNGAYYGASRTRRSAIAEHVNAIDGDCYKESNFAWNGLSDKQKAAWKKCQKSGDRVVKATLTWED